MIIYSGLGFSVPIIFLSLMFGLGIGLEALLGVQVFPVREVWPLLLTSFIASATIWLTGRFLNRKLVEVTVYEQTGRQTILKPKHTMYFIRMEYWGPISFAVAALGLTAISLR